MAVDSTSIRNMWANVERKYFVHEETIEMTKINVAMGNKSVFAQSLESYRDQTTRNDTQTLQQKIEVTNFQGTIEDITIPASHIAGGIKATVYKPKVLPPVPVVILYYIGGGLVCAQQKIYQACLMSLVNHTDAIIVSAEYRDLPCAEDRFAPFTDAEASAQWILDNKMAVGGVANSLIGLAGDSAGGQICASLSYTFPRKFAFQVLVYPVADVDLTNSESIKEFWRMPQFCGRDMEQMFKWCKLFDHPADFNNPRFNPSAPRSVSIRSNEPPLSASPPTLVIVAELDPLRDWGKAYAKKLRDAGVPVQFYTIESVPHGFFRRVDVYKTTAARAHRLVADFIRPFKAKL